MSPKEKLRGEIKGLLRNVKREEFRDQGAASAALLRLSPLWSFYTTVFLFLSTDSEIDTQPLLEAAFKDGKEVFVPKVSFVTGEGRLVFYRVCSPEGPWEKGAFGIREPFPRGEGEWNQMALPDSPVLVVVPGLAFDKGGNRLGKGGGYYDRFFGELAEGRRYSALGLCMDFQLVESVPVGEKDKRMDGILTQNELLEVN